MSLDPTIGRWISEDPIGFQAADANLYRYVGNDPVNNADPTGTILEPGAGESKQRAQLDAMELFDLPAGGRNGVPSIRLQGRLYGFPTKRDRDEFKAILPPLYAAAYTALADIRSVGSAMMAGEIRDPRLAAIQQRLARWFNNGRNMTRTELHTVEAVFAKTVKAFSTFLWIETGSETKIAARAHGWWSTPHAPTPYGITPPTQWMVLHKKYWSWGPRDRAEIVFHEMTHMFAYTEDGTSQFDAYVDDKDAAPVPTYRVKDVNGVVASGQTLPPRVLRNLADAYAHYLNEYYLSSLRR